MTERDGAAVSAESGAVGGLAASWIQARWSALRMLRGRTVWVS